MKKYILFDKDESGIDSVLKGFYDSDTPPEGAVIISQQDADYFIYAVNNQGKRLWYDGTTVHIRDMFSKYDQETGAFIADEETSNQKKIEELKIGAKLAFKRANLSPYNWNGLSENQQAELTSYLDILKGIINNATLDLSVMLPVPPGLLNEIIHD